MTILNIVVQRDAVIFGVDSSLHMPDGRECRASKLFYYNHVPAIFGGRGNYLIVSAIANGFLYGDARSVDDLAKSAPELAIETMKQLAPMLPAHAHDNSGALEFCVAGWSKSAGRMCGWWFRKDTNDPSFSRQELTPDFIAPWDGEIELRIKSFLARPNDPERMAALAGAQHRLYRTKRSKAVAGAGPFYMGELRRDRFTIFNLLDLPEV